MGVFGFIENFFFISLALVFVLVLLLVYHFKNRITVAEKKSESMYGLLTAVVKEIKSLRGMFGLANEQTNPTLPQPSNFEVKSKTEPEVIITPVSESAQNVNMQKKEVITLDLSASENKIVVSDDSDDDLSDDSDSEYEQSDSDDDEESRDVKQDTEVVDLDINVSELREQSVFEKEEPEEIDVSFDLVENVQDVSESLVTEIQANEVEEVFHAELERESLVDLKEPLGDSKEPLGDLKEPLVDIKEPLGDSNEQPVAPIPTIDQLRKMNINQLKTVASQIGIAVDTTKLKKPELISLIQTQITSN